MDGELGGFGPLRRARSFGRSVRCVSASGPGVTVGGLGLGLLLHPARLELRSSLLALEDRDLVAQPPDELGSAGAVLPADARSAPATLRPAAYALLHQAPAVNSGQACSTDEALRGVSLYLSKSYSRSLLVSLALLFEKLRTGEECPPFHLLPHSILHHSRRPTAQLVRRQQAYAGSMPHRRRHRRRSR